MNKNSIDYTLYLCTDRSLMSSPCIEVAVEQAIAGGAGVIQLREKEMDAGAFYELAVSVKRITAAHNVPLIINDRLDIALACDAEGVHLGQRDIPAAAARALLGKEKLLGVSVTTVEEACRAVADGADYLGVGAMFATDTKQDAAQVSMATLQQIRQAVSVPIVAIGGINAETICKLRGTGINGMAVVSALMAAQDVQAAARELIQKWKE